MYESDTDLIRVSFNRRLAYVLVDWAFGAVHVKIAVAFTLLGPNWWLRDALENIYNQVNTTHKNIKKFHLA